MILIGEILVSQDIVKKHFVCNLNACKGACCVEGDYGAPLEKKEVSELTTITDKILPYLPKESQEIIEQQGFYNANEETNKPETKLMANGACVFMGRNELGITFCGIEKAFNDNKIAFKKPISCHLYPIRVNKNERTGFQALNYDKWDICSAACTNGKSLKTTIHEFSKSALIRAYGEEFFEELDAAAKEIDKKEKHG